MRIHFKTALLIILLVSNVSSFIFSLLTAVIGGVLGGLTAANIHQKKKFTNGLTTEEKVKELFRNIHLFNNDVSKADLLAEWSNIPFLKRFTALHQYHKNLSSCLDTVIKYTSDSKMNKSTIEEFARSIVSHQTIPEQNVMEIMQDYIAPVHGKPVNERMFGLILEQIKLKNTPEDVMCNSMQSDQQLLHNWYSMALLMEIKRYVLMQFSYLILQLHRKGVYTTELELLKKRFKILTSQIYLALTNTTKDSSRELRRCDPPVHIPGTTFLEISICDETRPNLDCYFSTDVAMSNKEQNYIVTGLRFVKRNRIIHLQIQEGRLLPYGEIEKDSVRWVPVRDTQLDDTHFYRALSSANRSIDLDDIIAGSDEVLIGVSLSFESGHIGLEIISSRFDYETGKLHSGDVNVAKYSKAEPRAQINLNKADIPTQFKKASSIYSGPNHYIEFTKTDHESNEAQANVPFLDAQPVVAHPVIPLVGAGLYHKGQERSGGFIAPKIITLNLSKYIKFPQYLA